MRRIIKDEPPQFWVDYLKKNPKCTYDELNSSEEGKNTRQHLREHLLRNQKMICCYCCGCIDNSDRENCHIEHIKPRDHFPAESMNYGNLLVSCSNKDSCGNKKKNNFDAKTFVSPLAEDCEQHFYFRGDGLTGGNDEAGSETIKCLNLNDPKLVGKRHAVYKKSIEMAKYCGKDVVYEYFVKENDGRLPDCVDIITFFFNKGAYDLDF